MLQHKGKSEIFLINPVTSFVSFKDDTQGMSVYGQELARPHGCAFSVQLLMELQKVQINFTSRIYSGYPTTPADSHCSADLSVN